MNYDEFNKKIYGIKLKYYRILAELNQTELAQIMGVPQSMIARYESGKVMPEVATMKKIANALNTNLAEFFDTDTVFFIKESELGTTYELTEVEPKTREGWIFKPGSIDSYIYDLDDKDKWLIYTFATRIKTKNFKDEYFEERILYNNIMLDEAKEAQKDAKKLKHMQKVRDYIKSNGIDVEDPYKDYEEEYLEHEGISYADLVEKEKKAFDEFDRKQKEARLEKLRKEEQEIIKDLESGESAYDKQQELIQEWIDEANKNKK